VCWLCSEEHMTKHFPLMQKVTTLQQVEKEEREEGSHASSVI